MGGFCGFCRKYKENVTLHQNLKLMCSDCWQEYGGVPKKKPKFKLFETHIPELIKELVPHNFIGFVGVAALCMVQIVLLTGYFCLYICDIIDGDEL